MLKGWASTCPLTSLVLPLWSMKSTKGTGCRFQSYLCVVSNGISCQCQSWNMRPGDFGLTHHSISYVPVCYLVDTKTRTQNTSVSMRPFYQMLISCNTLLTVIIYAQYPYLLSIFLKLRGNSCSNGLLT